MWWSAYRMDMVPRAWGDGYGNHGPWRHLYFLRTGSGMWYPDVILHAVLCTLGIAVMLATLALVIAPSCKRVRLFVLCFGLEALFFYSHYWLVDRPSPCGGETDTFHFLRFRDTISVFFSARDRDA